MDEFVRPAAEPFHAPDVRSVSLFRCVVWLRLGFADLRRATPLSLSWGALFAAAGYWISLAGWTKPHLVPALISGFLLVAPFLLLGLYEISRSLGAGQSPRLSRSVLAWQANAGEIGLFGVVLAFLLLSWERMSAILFALFYSGSVPSLENFAQQVFLSGEHLRFVAAYLGFGGILAFFTFGISAVSIPMLLDRPVDVVTAMVTSLRVVALNIGAMLVWAAVIVLLTLIGFATLFTGMLVILPLLGHASWHAYKDLVEQ